MNILEGQAALDYINQNPNANFDVLDEMGGVQESFGYQPNIIESILGGIIDPFANIIERGAEADIAARSGSNIFNQEYTPVVMQQEELQQFQENPLLDTAQNVAGVASFAVPGGGFVGGGIRGAIAAGALSGALGGFSQAEEDNLLQGTIEGGLFGGATGGALGLAGKGLSRLAGLGDEAAAGATQAANQLDELAPGLPMQGNRIGAFQGDAADAAAAFGKAMQRAEQVGLSDLNPLQRRGLIQQARQAGLAGQKNNLKFVTGFEDTVRNFDDARRFFGVEKGPKATGEVADRMGNLLENTVIDSPFQATTGSLMNDDVLNQMVRGTTAKLKTRDAAQQILRDNLSNIVPEVGERIAQLPLDDFIAGRATLSAPELLQAKRATYEVAQKVGKAIKAGKEVAPDAFAKYQIHEWAKKSLNDNIPGVEQINETFARTFEQNPGMVQAWNTGQGGNFVASPAQIGQALFNQARGMSGNVLEAAGNIRAGARINIPGQQAFSNLAGVSREGLQALAENPQAMRALIAAQQAARVAGPMAAVSAANAPQGQVTQQQSMGAGQPMRPAVGRQVDPMESQIQEIGLQMLANGMAPSKVEKEMDALRGIYGVGGSGGASTEKQRQFANAAQSANYALNLLESGLANTGKIQSVASGVTGFFGTKTPEQTDYESNLALARGMAMNALAGANISQSEAERVAAAIPELTDEPNIAKQKLRSFINQMQSFGEL